MSLQTLITTTTQLAKNEPQKWGEYLELLKELERQQKDPQTVQDVVNEVARLFRLSNEPLSNDATYAINQILVQMSFYSKLKRQDVKAITAAREIARYSSGLVGVDAVFLILLPYFKNL